MPLALAVETYSNYTVYVNLQCVDPSSIVHVLGDLLACLLPRGRAVVGARSSAAANAVDRLAPLHTSLRASVCLVPRGAGRHALGKVS